MIKKIIVFLFPALLPLYSFSSETAAWLGKVPVIDGCLDSHICPAELKTFNNIYKTGDKLDDVEACYFLGYTTTHFYVYIQTHGDHFTVRDRAYQNGDGFHLMIGKTLENNEAAEEFYIMGFSPAQDWSRKFQWYYNIDLAMRRLDDQVKFETSEKNGTLSFELLIPWSKVKPFHPWINDRIGFNLCFVRAIHESEKIYYFIKTDPGMQSEQSKREYIKLDFEKPSGPDVFFTMPSRYNYEKNQPLTLEIAGVSDHKFEKQFKIKCLTDSGEIVFSEKHIIQVNPGLSRLSIDLENCIESAGNFDLHVYDNGSLSGRHRLSVFEPVSFQAYRQILSEHRQNIAEGSYHTALMEINALEKKLETLKYYESSEEIGTEISRIQNLFDAVRSSNDPVAERRGIYRRSFLSELDSTIRPYTIYIPENYCPDSEYPLLVYLHGSGEDDRALFRTAYIKEDFIVIAPNGRGTSNCFAVPESQTDIKEAIEDARKNFSIDKSRIILSGFSMGGYGVYRTYYEDPDTYAALAVLSGHPALAENFGIENAPNFLEDQYTAYFSDIPIFIFHGKKDLNCPYKLTGELAEKLKAINSRIIFLADENAGHERMNDEMKELYHEWLRQF